MPRRIARDKGRPQLACQKRAVLFVNRAHFGALRIIQHRQIDRAGDVVFGIFSRRADINDIIKP